jgi:hypothetical protein
MSALGWVTQGGYDGASRRGLTPGLPAMMANRAGAAFRVKVAGR